MIRGAIIAASVFTLSLAVFSSQASAGGGCHGEATTVSGDGTAVGMDGCSFTPALLYIDPGDTVTWENTSDYPHTVTGGNGDWGSNGDLLSGETLTQRFDAEGAYPYACALHPGMVGAVLVGDATVPPTGFVSVAPVSLREPSAGDDPPSAETVPTSDGSNDTAIAIAVLAGAATFAVCGIASASAFVLGRRTR
jgi:plastocyanin